MRKLLDKFKKWLDVEYDASFINDENDYVPKTATNREFLLFYGGGFVSLIAALVVMIILGI